MADDEEHVEDAGGTKAWQRVQRRDFQPHHIPNVTVKKQDVETPP
jgi:hypothetical protein